MLTLNAVYIVHFYFTENKMIALRTFLISSTQSLNLRFVTNEAEHLENKHQLQLLLVVVINSVFCSSAKNKPSKHFTFKEGHWSTHS